VRNELFAAYSREGRGRFGSGCRSRELATHRATEIIRLRNPPVKAGLAILSEMGTLRLLSAAIGSRDSVCQGDNKLAEYVPCSQLENGLRLRHEWMGKIRVRRTLLCDLADKSTMDGR
jgi:hypothetical protein